MDLIHQLSVFAAGVCLGTILTLFLFRIKKKETDKIICDLIMQSEFEKNRNLELLIQRAKDSFGDLSYKALSRNTDEFLKIAHEIFSRQTQSGQKDLDEKKHLIDQNLNLMRGDLHKVHETISALERDREKKYGELAQQLKSASEETARLQETTSKLQNALSNSKVRGQWGERMAEDVLRIAGFIEGINYFKQKKLNSAHTRPDYTFLLPRNLRINMDVKFPLDNYLRFLEAEKETEKDRFLHQFLRDARMRIREVTSKEYINPEEHTVDYVVVFIPNEQVYSFICEHDTSIIDEALESKVILSSPVTLYAILAVIRQAVDNFNMEQKASEIMVILNGFKKQWNSFVASFDKMGKKLGEAQKEYSILTSTRTNKLEIQLQQIEELRMNHDGRDKDEGRVTEFTGSD
ncbi:MAG: DNA recombination protein RmuC [Syntrophales bacterium]|jgi:DNA recombination protein RmuC|nr:DNA recombination protein RmuC [Syntrophales bacterium]MDY0043850.1 DNA recombination protein RmuC [Syntrophales bacterium]